MLSIADRTSAPFATRAAALFSSAVPGRLAGALAIGSGFAYLAYLFVGDATREQVITAWNLLITFAAIWLGLRVAQRGSVLAILATSAGVLASLLWAFVYHEPQLEPWWLGLAACWWLGVGLLLRRDRRALGTFTLLLGVAAAMDFVLTVLDAPMPIYALGGFKLPLTIVWSFWIGGVLLLDPLLGRDRQRGLP